MEIIDKSIRGDFRELNEDSTGVFYNKTNQVLFLVADGMGGHAHGDVASKFVNDEIQKAWQAENLIKSDYAEEFLRDLVIKTNRKLYDLQNAHDEYSGMGTTLVLASIIDDAIFILNIGDSRAYAMKRRSIEQVTTDHSFVNLLVESGEITKEEAINHPKRNVITKAMGSERLIQPDIFRLRNRQYDYILLASDGLTDVLREDSIHSTVYQKNSSLQERLDSLIRQAEENASRDNISICLADLKAGAKM
ncbi:Stp1/IreP family PP2C-type Ser/Thr phosphatase [Lacicoccus qingdaonensis]|uniref:Protein phosphatase n=1 Tax=Lacicoccus qingdaonensis TaxID=576118 RepID=A0A1G9A7Q2_9BACL|nr:Stp1/IreP family PP2C-type Ser/Thr phosphatase [Salinicoccus qingdaonensis]SDK22480.1 protein phosphatase [Salinicoccus qingdaonensis]